MTQRPIRFVHRGAIVEVTDLPPTTTVLAWLREHAACTGTKEGCNEGDCGACMVMVGEPTDGATDQADPGASPGVQWRTVNACIQFLPALDGRALRTVEDLPADHPAPQAMVACHGSQCGFCTPGFVVSLAHVYEQAHGQSAASARPVQPPSRRDLADALSGNLCRCTGYRPILDAGEAMFRAPLPASPASPAAPDPTAALLRTLRDDPPLDYRTLDPATGNEARFLAPKTLDAAADLSAAHPQATLLAGSTDIGLWSNKQFRPLPLLIHLGAIDELRRIDTADGHLRIGAGASLAAAWDALAAHRPELREMGLRFASPPVRHAGTMGGNVANGSPIGDAPPVLLALDAQLVLRRGADERRLPLDAFYLDYMKNARRPGELLVRIDVPLDGPLASPAGDHDGSPGWQVRAYKLSKRYDCDISGLACGFAIDLDGGTVRAARLAFGGLAATVKRARHAEAALVGQPWTEPTLRAAQAALAQDFQPLTDLRGSAGYRNRSARALLERLWLETRPDHALPASATQVWHHGAPAGPDAIARPLEATR